MRDMNRNSGYFVLYCTMCSSKFSLWQNPLFWRYSVYTDENLRCLLLRRLICSRAIECGYSQRQELIKFGSFKDLGRFIKTRQLSKHAYVLFWKKLVSEKTIYEDFKLVISLRFEQHLEDQNSKGDKGSDSGTQLVQWEPRLHFA